MLKGHSVSRGELFTLEKMGNDMHRHIALAKKAIAPGRTGSAQNYQTIFLTVNRAKPCRLRKAYTNPHAPVQYGKIRQCS